MARTRSLKPGFFKNELLVELPFEARLLFAGLWTLADREGRLGDRPSKIKMEIFPCDNLDVDMLLGLLANAHFITRYEAGNQKYIQIDKFTEHQRPHPKETPSIIPPCKATAGRTLTRQSREKGETTVNREIGLEEGKEETENGIEGKGLGSGEGAPEVEAEKGRNWVADFYEVFRSAWNGHYAGQDYNDARGEGEFGILGALSRNRSLNPETWAMACRHYFASPLKKHTLPELVKDFPAYLDHAVDRYGKPVRGNGHLTTREAKTVEAGNRVLQRIQNDIARARESH